MRPPDFVLPLPDALDEFLAAEFAAMDLPLHELTFHHHLGGDARMVHARLPQHVPAAHALEAAQDVLDRVVQRVAHMKRAGDVRRRNDDRVGNGVAAILAPGLEGLRLVPAGGNSRLDGGGIERLVHHRVLPAVGAPGRDPSGQTRRRKKGQDINELENALPGKPVNFPTT